MNKYKKITVILIFYTIIFSFMVATFFIPHKEMSIAERRKLTKKPTLSISSIMDKSYFENFEKYALDHFISRDYFRVLKTFANLNLLNMSDDNDFCIIDDSIIKLEKRLNDNGVNLFVKKINKIIKNSKGANGYYVSIIPDKSFFANDYPTLDYDKIFTKVKKEIKSAKYINISSLLTLDDYYFSDPHWKQQNIEKIAKELCNQMNTKYISSKNKSYNDLGNFYGTYYEQLPVHRKGDKLILLTSEDTDNAVVKSIENNEQLAVYNKNISDKLDKYDAFLHGATPLLTIENRNSKSSKELVIFRDSFTSSLAPLLIPSYKTITLVDIRYMSSKKVNDYVDYKGKDILFLYSTSIVNSGGILR